MNEKDIAKLALHLTDESKIVFTDGTVVEGARQVTEVMLGAAKAYTEGYLIGRRQLKTKVIVGGLLICGAVVRYRRVKSTQKFRE